MDNLKTDNWLTNWMVDRIADSTQYQPGTRRPEATGWAGAVGSVLGFNTNAVARQRNKDVQNTEALDYLDSMGITPEELGLKPGSLTKSGAATAIRDYKEGKEKDAKNEQRQYEAGIRQEGYTRQDNLLNHQFRTQQASNAHTASETAKDRSLTRDLQNSSDDLKMQMAFMNADLEDKRMEYDRETRRMDKRDAAIAQLMKGIGQLGGAFSL